MFCNEGNSLARTVFKEAGAKIKQKLKEYKREKNLKESESGDAFNDFLAKKDVLKNYSKATYAAQFKNILNLAMSMDPHIKGSLDNWKSACDAFDRAERVEAPISSFFTGRLFASEPGRINDMANNSCKESINKLSNTLCVTDPLIPEPGEGTQENPIFQARLCSCLNEVLSENR